MMAPVRACIFRAMHQKYILIKIVHERKQTTTTPTAIATCKQRHSEIIYFMYFLYILIAVTLAAYIFP